MITSEEDYNSSKFRSFITVTHVCRCNVVSQTSLIFSLKHHFLDWKTSALFSCSMAFVSEGLIGVCYRRLSNQGQEYQPERECGSCTIYYDLSCSALYFLYKANHIKLNNERNV